MGNSLNAGDIELDEKFTLITSEDSVAVSVTQPMKEIEPEVEVDEDELFLDEDGEPIEKEEGEITIEPNPRKNKKNDNLDGEYVDYEEVD